MILHKPADYQQPTKTLFASLALDLSVGMTHSADAPNIRLAVALRRWLRAHRLDGSVPLARRGISPPGIKYIVARSLNARLPKVTVGLPCCLHSSFVYTGFCCCVFFITPGVALDICDSNWISVTVKAACAHQHILLFGAKVSEGSRSRHWRHMPVSASLYRARQRALFAVGAVSRHIGNTIVQGCGRTVRRNELRQDIYLRVDPLAGVQETILI
jgi:hypothetical protein